MVGGGSAGGKDTGAGGGGAAVLYGTNMTIPAGNYNLYVGNGATAANLTGASTTGFGATILGGGSTGQATWATTVGPNWGGSGSGGKSAPFSVNAGGVNPSTEGTYFSIFYII
jgi:hypothetical protein